MPVQLTPQMILDATASMRLRYRCRLRRRIPRHAGDAYIVRGRRCTSISAAAWRVAEPSVRIGTALQAGADIAMVTHGDVRDSSERRWCVRIRRKGKPSAVVPIDELYDEFNFGERSPFAIRRFLQAATQNWKKAPTLSAC